MTLGIELERLAEAMDFPVTALRLSVAVLFAYLAGFLFNRLPNDQPNLKHLFSLLVAFLLHVEVLSDWLGLAHLGTAALATYAVAATIRHAMMPQLVVLLTMLHLSFT
jgi:lysophospholipid acyltransferase